MATAPEESSSGFNNFLQSPLGSNLALGAGIALVASIMIAVWMWGQKPDYRILLSNFTDKDGGSIIAALQQMNVPYQYSEGGTAILVPAERVHDARLKLAAQGLPKAGNAGFELMENQKLGVSQFLEQANFQHALEGELARSINSISVVASSRVHLAIPKPTVFVREIQKPTASVLLNLHPGRVLEPQQVRAIVHLVSSSVPDLPAQNVTVVDENGNLLSDQADNGHNNKLDPNQLKYIQEIQEGIVRRIESILTPMVGAENVRAEASAEIDFSHTEQAAEKYTPNNKPENTAKRSEHLNESKSTEGGGDSSKPGGVPGASSNQPGQQKSGSDSSGASSSQKDDTINYELDKTVRYVQEPMGNIKRLTVAVLVNNKTEIGTDGKPTTRALTDAEKEQITGLVKDAMGFNKDRGDSLNVANAVFTIPAKEIIPEEPFWKPYANIETAKSAGEYLLTLIAILYLFFKFLRPMLRKVINPNGEKSVEEQPPQPKIAEPIPDEPPPPPPKRKGEDASIDDAKELAIENPRLVAHVVKNWVNE
ncbi:MAG: flagellar basal-body MS-ring/collar protein FliF [Methylococcales bacterium]